MVRTLVTVALAGALAGCGVFKVGPDYAGAPAARSLSQAEAGRGAAAPAGGSDQVALRSDGQARNLTCMRNANPREEI